MTARQRRRIDRLNLTSVTPVTDIPPIRFAPARGARIAYQIFGSGPNLVAIPPTAQHIEMAWEWPTIRSMLQQFGSFSTYLHFDKRGTGTSDRKSRVSGVDERVDDLRAVMDHAGVDRAHLFACSEGGPMAILFAATYPERVESLTFHGSCAAYLPRDAGHEEIARRVAGHREYARRWGTNESPVAAGFAPSLASDSEFVAWHRRYERSAASQDSLIELLDLTLEMDVRDLLPTLHTPTLVLHRRGDRVMPIQFGRELAALIPGAELVELEGDDHFQYAGDVKGWMDEVQRFVTGSVTARAPLQRPRARINTLGRFAVFRDDVEVPLSEWGSRLARQICKRLVAARGWPVTRDELIDMCWPDESDMRKLGARLSVQLSSVRRVLDGGVVADRSTVRLDLDTVSTDLETFFNASDDGSIVAAYAGEFLPGDRYEDWTVPLREEIRGRFLSAGHRLGTELDDPDRSVWLARRLLEADLFDEMGHRLLIASLLSSGETREAERAHANWVAAAAEIGNSVAPLESLRPT